MRLFSGKKSVFWGLDLSPAAIRLLALSQQNGRYCVDAHAVEPMPYGIMPENSITDIEALGKLLKQVCKKAGVRNKHVAIAMANSAVVSKTISMPADLSERDMESQILLEADQDIPFPLDEVSLDFTVQGPSSYNAGNVDVLWVASHSENVDDRIAALEEAGLSCELVDVESHALESACQVLAEQWPDKGQDKRVVMVDIGEQISMLNVFYNKALIETSEQHFGYTLLLDDIQQQYALSAKDARIRMQRNDLPKDYAANVLAPFLQSLVQQIERVVQNTVSFDSKRVDLVVLSGVGAMLPGIVDAVQSQMGVLVKQANPFTNMTLGKKVHAADLRKHAPSLLVACGLALRSFD